MSARLRRSEPGHQKPSASPSPSLWLHNRGDPSAASPHGDVTSSPNFSSLVAPPWSPLNPRHPYNSPQLGPFSPQPECSTRVPSPQFHGGISVPRSSCQNLPRYPNRAASPINPIAVPSEVNETVDGCQILGCHDCGERFSGKYARGNLGRHRRELHGSNRPRHYCAVPGCFKDFARSDGVHKHMRNVHSEMLSETHGRTDNLQPTATKPSRSLSNKSRSSRSSIGRRPRMPRRPMSDNGMQSSSYYLTVPYSSAMPSRGHSPPVQVSNISTFESSLSSIGPWTRYSEYHKSAGSSAPYETSFQVQDNEQSSTEDQPQPIFASDNNPQPDPPQIDHGIPNDEPSQSIFPGYDLYALSVPYSQHFDFHSHAQPSHPSWQQNDMQIHQPIDPALQDSQQEGDFTYNRPSDSLHEEAHSLQATAELPIRSRSTPILRSSPSPSAQQDGPALETADQSHFPPSDDNTGHDNGNEYDNEHRNDARSDYGNGYSNEYDNNYGNDYDNNYADAYDDGDESSLDPSYSHYGVGY